MAAASALPALVTIEECLSSSYEPDLEFVDGVLEEKTMGKRDHGFLQAAISAWFFNSGRVEDRCHRGVPDEDVPFTSKAF